MRKPIDQKRIVKFLEALGKEIDFPAKLYLVGGTSLVYFGLRQQSIDIDVSLDVDSKNHHRFIEALRKIKESLDVNIDEANPGDFIPLPSGWKERSISIGRFGNLHAFHFDLYATALSKIERGSELDFDDVLGLIQVGKINANKLEALYGEILPRFGRESLRQDPESFKRNFEILKKKLKKPPLKPKKPPLDNPPLISKA